MSIQNNDNQGGGNKKNDNRKNGLVSRIILTVILFFIFILCYMFISSEIVKWKLGTWEVLDRMPVYYSIGHLMIPGGDGTEPYGK